MPILYTIPHKLLKLLSEVSNFDFKSKVGERIAFSKTSTCWISKEAGRRYFTKQTLVSAMSFLINNCFFTITNMTCKQNIGKTMCIDLAPSWTSLFLYFFESKFIKQLILNGSTKVCKYYGVSRFADDLSTVNDDNEFLTSFRNILELELKLEHQETMRSSHQNKR